MAEPGLSHRRRTTPADRYGWAGLFWIAFRRSRNGMALLDEHRRYVEANAAYAQILECPRDALIGRPAWETVVDGPIMNSAEWRTALSRSQFTAVAELRSADGSAVPVEIAAHPEVVTGRRLVLLVILRAERPGAIRGIAAVAPPTGALSPREAEVVGLLALGMSGPEIATELSVSHNTVRTHVGNAMKKLGARTRAQLVAMSLADGGAAPL